MTEPNWEAEAVRISEQREQFDRYVEEIVAEMMDWLGNSDGHAIDHVFEWKEKLLRSMRVTGGRLYIRPPNERDTAVSSNG